MYHPGYFGKVGMRHFHHLKQKYWAPSVNVDKLWSFVDEKTKQQMLANPKSKTVPVVNVLNRVSVNIFLHKKKTTLNHFFSQ